MKKIIFIFLAYLMIMTPFFSCSHTGEGNAASNSSGKMEYAENLFMEEHEGYTLVTVRNPWDTLKNLARYVIVPRDTKLPDSLPAGTLIRTPVEKALIYSSVHSGLISSLGAVEAIGGVCNASYVTDSLLKARIEAGETADCGADMTPDIERIIKLHPQIVMRSPFESGTHYAKIEQLGIPTVECADYMENSALAQAEWMKFYGLLFGRRDEAYRRFDSIASRYQELKGKAASAPQRPKILLDNIYGQSWSVPGGKSTMGRLIEDAGGTNPFARYDRSGGVPLSPEKVLVEAGDADIWLLRYFQQNDKTLPELSRDASVNSQFKAFKTGEVYGCNTSSIPFFDETPFRPDLLLEDMVMILHPGLLPGATPRYFKKMEK
ncbi:MAG: ABC transporter substrate-binding protein [Muribaculaceae bacterium]|nr:ABC transporter substrate-binding protein [Muribaculaceae bacterium]